MEWRELAAVFSDLPADRVARWVGECRVHAAQTVPSVRRWSLLSSRLPKALDEHPEWFQRLRTACEEARGAGGWLVAVEGTAACRYVLHAARHFGLPTIYLRFATQPATLSGRVTSDGPSSQLSAETSAEPSAELSAELSDADGSAESLANSPRGASGTDTPATTFHLWVRTDSDRSTEADGAVPLRDRLLWLLGQEIRVLAARRGGSVERMIADQRRESPDWRPVRLDGPETAPASRPSQRSEPSLPARRSQPAAIDIATLPLPWPALWHATRRHEGPWDEQTETEFLDELLFERPERDRSALATLMRIVRERRLRASPLAIRGGAASVCWSAAPLEQRPALRTYRAHRGRWDAEPFGIAIRMDRLATCGARPAIYGDESVWEKLAEPDRPWFQLQTTRAGKRPIDWSREQEWRLLGDLWLDDLPRDDVRIFVADMDAAARVAAMSPWTVVVLNADESRSAVRPEERSQASGSGEGER